jgi:DNA-directed RNA polymerase beta subunit
MALFDPTPAPTKPPVKFRRFDDINTQRQDIYDSALNAVSALNGLENATHKLEVADLSYDDYTPGLDDDKKAVLKAGSLHRALKGTVRLLDKQTGNVLDERRETLAHVPHLNDRGVFIRKGVTYVMRNQARLRPGAYTRRKSNGGVETQFNVKGARGFRIELEPESGVYKFTIGQSGTRLYPLLRSLGVQDEELKTLWGEELFNKNYRDTDGRDEQELRKVIEKLGGKADADSDLLPGILRDVLGRGELDEETTKVTLGESHKNVSTSTLLKATLRQLAVARQEAEEDNRDSQAFQSLHSAEDFFAERLKKDRAGMFRNLLWKAAKTGKLDSLRPGYLNPNIAAIFNGTGLAAAVEDVNPAEIFDLRGAITRMGEGGISDESSVSRAARDVQASYLGVIDPIRAPESSRMGLDLRVTSAALKGSDNKIYTQVRNLKTGVLETVSAGDLNSKITAFPGELASGKPRIAAVKGNNIVYVKPEEADYELPSAKSMFSTGSLLVPLPQGVKGQRLLMGARMTQQASSLLEPEAPLVQGADDDDVGFNEKLGSYSGARYSPVDGVVTKVTPQFIEVASPEGRKKIELYNYYPTARRGFIHNTPQVKVGDSISKGGLLASSNFTDPKGAFTVGKNFRVGYMADHGYTLEDAFVISESAAKKLSSQHLYKHDLDLTNIKSTNKSEYLSIYGDKFKPEQLENIGDDGVVKVGTKVNPGDPIILGLGERSARLQGLDMASTTSALADRTQVWEHEAPGVVTDVYHTRSGINVTINSHSAASLSDKLSGTFGNKGVISRIVPDDQMPKDSNGQPLEILMNPLGIISRTNPAALAVALLGKVAAKTGKPYKLKPFSGDDLTEFALQEALKHGVATQDEKGNIIDTETVTDKDGRKIPGVFTGNVYLMRLHHDAEKKLKARSTAGYTIDDLPAKGGSTGCFVPNQKILTIHGYRKISSICEKTKAEQVRTWSEELNEWIYRPITDWFTYRAKVADIVSVYWVGPSIEAEYKDWSLQSFSSTKNHMVLSQRGWITAGELTTSDYLYTWGVTPTEDQWSILLGSLLGDSALMFDQTEMVEGWQCEHSIKQVDYVDWKRKQLAGLGVRQYDQVHAEGKIHGCSRATVRSRSLQIQNRPLAERLHALGYQVRNKRLTKDWLDQLTELAFAVWFIDDGCLSSTSKKKNKPRYQAVLATHSFTYEEVLLIQKVLFEKFGLITGLTTSSTPEGSKFEQYYVITFSNKAAIDKIVNMVGTTIPVEAIPKTKRSLIKLIKDYGLVPRKLDTTNVLTKIPVRVKEVKPYVHDKPEETEINVYDFTVKDTHTYIAGSVIVSNSKRIGGLDVFSLTSAGATKFLAESKLIRGQRNDDYWRALKSGETPIRPTSVRSNEQFKAYLRAAGINLLEDGNKETLRPMLDKDVDELAQHEIQNSATFDFDTNEPIGGGLFDIATTGGAGGNRYSKIVLPAKVPHPMFIEPIIRILGLTESKFEDVLGGKEQLDGKTGPGAIEHALDNINLDREMEAAKVVIKSNKASQRDAAVKRLHYLAGLKNMNIQPKDLMISKLPVVPPKHRPVIKARDMEMVHDLNYLYHDVLEAKDNYNKLNTELGDASDQYLTLYKTVKALIGKEQPVSKRSQDQQVRGVLAFAIGKGDSPKFSTFQRKVIGTTVDQVGLGVVTSDPELRTDEVGIPDEMAWTIFKPFVIRRLVRNGLSAAEAVKAVKDRNKMADMALDEEMTYRPVVYNRAPALHRYAYTGAMAKRRKDNSIGVPFSVLKRLGMDFDGDTSNVHAVIEDDTIEEVKNKLFPSKNLFFAGNFEPDLEPVQDYIAGLYSATRPDLKQEVKIFPDAQAAKAAYARGEIRANTPIKILS